MWPIIGSTTWRRLSSFFKRLGRRLVWLISSLAPLLGSTPR
jgi:hypothetical protein